MSRQRQVLPGGYRPHPPRAPAATCGPERGRARRAAAASGRRSRASGSMAPTARPQPKHRHGRAKDTAPPPAHDGGGKGADGDGTEATRGGAGAALGRWTLPSLPPSLPPADGAPLGSPLQPVRRLSREPPVDRPGCGRHGCCAVRLRWRWQAAARLPPAPLFLVPSRRYNAEENRIKT